MIQTSNQPEIDFPVFAKFQAKQQVAWNTLLNPLCKYLLYGGAAGGGKSYLLRWSALGLAMYYFAKYDITRVPIGLFSEDYPTLRDRQVTKITREFPESMGVLKETQRDGLAFYMTPEYGAGIIMLRNLDDPSKYASVEFAAILVEELTKNPEVTFEDLRTRLRFPGIEERKFVGATNPGQVGHGWVKRKWVKIEPTHKDIEQNRFFFVSAKYFDNRYNPSDYSLQLAAIGDRQKREALLEGSWDVFAGQFFDEWNPNLHTISSFLPIKGSLIVGGMDWGRAKPFSFHLSEITKVFFENMYFYRVKTFFEIYGIEKSPMEWSREIIASLTKFGISLTDIAWVRCDPTVFNKGNDNSVSIAQQFKDDNFNWRVLQPANNDRIAGWAIMHNWLSTAPDNKPYWQVTQNCNNLIRTLPDLVHDENIVEDIDSDGEDHAADDQRYQFKHIKWVDGLKTGLLHPQMDASINASKFWTPNEDSSKMLIDLDAFVK